MVGPGGYRYLGGNGRGAPAPIRWPHDRYAIAHLRSVRLGPDIVEYLERIDAMLEPFGGRFLVHGDPPDVRAGEWPGDLIVIEFPDRESATAWYESPAYQEIVPLRTRNADGTAIIVDRVGPDHRATDVLRAGLEA